MPRSIYVLRIKPGLQDMVPEALAANQLIIGWTDVPQLLDRTFSLEDYRSALSAEYYPAARTLGRAGSAAGNMWRFLRDMQIGDVVLVPHRKNFYVAEVTGEPTHDATVEEGGFRRAVKWLNHKLPFIRVDEPDVYRALLERKTCYQVGVGYLPAVQALIDRLLPMADVVQDLARLQTRNDIDATVREALSQARIGQGRFRQQLLECWGNACAVTGCVVLPAIRASHAQPWRMSTDEERLDCNNGLPLLASLDALFDAGLIAFAQNGDMLVSGRLSRGDQALLGVPARLRKAPTEAQDRYLKIHRDSIFCK